MPQLTLDLPDRAEVLRYLGWHGAPIDAHTGARLAEAMREAHATATPRATYALAALSPDAQPLGIGLAFEGDAIAKHLAGCTRCALLAATLGTAVDALIRRAQTNDMAYAVLLDAAASTLIEQAADRVQQTIAHTVPEPYMTHRFSPGYADLPLTLQQGLARVLDTQRAIGLAVTGHSLLTPRKSVTAIVGLAHTPLQARGMACGYCSLSKTCAYKKGGLRCDASGENPAP